MPPAYDEADVRLWEIAENLHRAELTVQERANETAEWIKLTELKIQLAQVAPPENPAGPTQQQGRRSRLPSHLSRSLASQFELEHIVAVCDKAAVAGDLIDWHTTGQKFGAFGLWSS